VVWRSVALYAYDSHVSEPKTTGPAPARTTVLVLNYNGREHLDECLGSLGAQDVFIPGWPGQPRDATARDEIWLIDNASTDGSVEHVTERFPWVRPVESEANLGFSRAYNRAAAMCGSEYVVFLNNDTRVGPDFLTCLHRTRAAHPEAKAVAARIMSWDGTRIDFTGADTFFSGHAWQRGLGEEAGAREFAEAPLLFGCAGALMFDRETFIGIGGFDPDYFSFFEDVDLGWRATLLGHPTWFAPGAVVRHKHHGSWAEQPPARVRYLTERNALFTVFKNYHQERMGVMLLLSAALTFARAWSSSDSLRNLGRPFVSTEAVAHLLALADLSGFVPSLRQRRKRVQADRRRTDEEILRLFGAFASPPTALGEEYRTPFHALLAAAGIADDKVGGPWPAEVNTAAEAAALQLAGVCAASVGRRFPAESFLVEGWDGGWEHQVAVEEARALCDVQAAIARFVEAGISTESLAALREDLRRTRPGTVETAAAAPSVRRFGKPPASGILAAGTPSVSVVIRTKDRPGFLRRTLASVAAQSYPRLEVVVVNDGGEDPSQVLAEFENALEIFLVNHPDSVGRSRAAQAGLEAATGELVNFLDDDDEFRPGHLATLVGAVTGEGVRVAYSDVECLTEEPDGSGGYRVVDRTVLGGDLDRSRLFFESTLPIMAVLMDRKLAIEVGGFDPDLEYFEDWDLFLRLAHRTRLHHCPAVTATYHVCPPLQQGKGTAGSHRWPHLARLFDKHRGQISGKDWARFYQRQVETTRQRLQELERRLGELTPRAEYLKQHLNIIESSRGWRLYQRARRFLGRQ
jgi:GT2 family glycosyltransferase